MLASLEDGGSSDLAGRSGRRKNETDVVVSVVYDLIDTVMKESDSDNALCRSDVLGRTGAGLGVDFDVLVEVYEVLYTFVMTVFP